MGEGYGILHIKSNNASGELRVTSPGFSKINIDVKYQKRSANGENTLLPLTKRITLEPEELEANIMEDIIEQFVIEFKTEVNDDNS